MLVRQTDEQHNQLTHKVRRVLYSCPLLHTDSHVTLGVKQTLVRTLIVLCFDDDTLLITQG